MASNWQPNVEAKPFIPSSAAYVLRLPCCMRPMKIRRRGILGRCLQVTLVSVLIITVVFNVLFIIDNSKRLRTQKPSRYHVEDTDDEIGNTNIILEQTEDKKEGTICRAYP